MRLLYAFPEPLPLPRARGLQAVSSARAMAAAGIETLLVHGRSSEAAEPLAACGVEPHERLRTIALSRRLVAAVPRPQSNRFFMARLARVIDAEAPDAVFVRHIKLAALLRGRFPRLPIVYEAHEVFADTAARPKRARTMEDERAALQAANAIVANSRGTAARLGVLYRVDDARVTVIPNGVSRPAQMPARDWRRPNSSIVYAGSLFPWKGVDVLVAAAEFLPGSRITIAGGDAEEVAALRAKVPEGGATVEFAGRLGAREVRALLERSAIAVLPNRDDAESAFTSPIKLFEYMAAGCAVVASDLPAMREILPDGEAEFARAGDARALAAAIARLGEDSARAERLGRMMYERSREYTWAARGERLAAVVRRVAATS